MSEDAGTGRGDPDESRGDQDAVIQNPYDMAGATKTITLRLPPEEHAAWQTAAAADQRTLSSWIRKQCSVVAPSAAPTVPKLRRKLKRKVR